MTVNTKSRLILPSLAAMGARIRAVRLAKGMNQKDFALGFEVSQGAISNWEKGVDRPSPRNLAKLASWTANDELRDFFLSESGLADITSKNSTRDEKAVSVRLLRDAVAAGTPRALDEEQIDDILVLPRRWFPRSGELFALKVSGESMAPIIHNGYLVFVDTSKRDPKKLVERMVAAREGDGVTIKWLRRDGDTFLLVPQHTSPLYPVRVMRAEGDFSIVGEVVKWVGQPGPPRKA